MDSTIGPEHRGALLGVLADTTFFGGGNKPSHVLGYLVEQTLKGRTTIPAADVAGALGIAERNVASYIARTRIRLNRFESQKTPGDRSEYEFYVLQRRHVVCYRPKAGAGVAATPTELRPWPGDRETDHGIAPSEFKEFLESLVEEEDIRDSRLRIWAGGVTRFSDFCLSLDENTDAGVFNSFFKHLQAVRDGGFLRYSEMRNLMLSLGVHPLMLDPLLSKAVDGRAVAVCLPGSPMLEETSPTDSSEFRQIGKKDADSYGAGAQYAIPTKRLRGTEASVVYLILDPGKGHSDDHHHPGDELMVVLKGLTRVCFRGTGDYVDLSQGSYVHFYSEQTHSAWNLSSTEETHLLVVRFYQSNPDHDSRQASGRRLRKWLRSRPARVTADLRDLDLQMALEKVSYRMTFENQGVGADLRVSSQVRNTFGLARLLAKLQKVHPLSSAQLMKLTADLGVDPALARDQKIFLWNLAAGRIPFEASRLSELADAFGAFEPMLWEFLFPSVSGQVVIRHGQSRNEAIEDWVGLSDVFNSLHLSHAKNPTSAGVHYEIPIRVLACSDTAIARLVLEPGTNCPWNEHPGTELLIAINGEARVEFDSPGAACAVSAGKLLAHYRTETRHRILNDVDAKQNAELLVVRFFGETAEAELTSRSGN